MAIASAILKELSSIQVRPLQSRPDASVACLLHSGSNPSSEKQAERATRTEGKSIRRVGQRETSHPTSPQYTGPVPASSHHSYSSRTDGQRPAALVIELAPPGVHASSILSPHVIMSLPHTPIANTAWQHPQAHPTPHGPQQAYGLAGLPPDSPLPQPPMVSSSLASPFHPGTTLGSSQGGRSKNGDRFHDVRQLFARRELERQSSVATRGGKRCFCDKELEDEEDIYCSSGALGLHFLRDGFKG